MSAREVTNELAKLRHLHIGTVATIFVVGVVGLSLVGMLTGEIAPLTWGVPLASLSLAFPIASPLLVAVVASRVVEIEHEGNGWLLSRTAGVDRGRLCRAKVIGTGIIVATATAVASIAVLSIGFVVGTAEPLPVGLWFGYTAAVVVVNVVVLAVQVVISARIDNQLIALGLGVLGTVIAICAPALQSWIAHLTPWGYYSLVTAAEYHGDDVITLSPSYPSVIVLAAVAAVAFSAVMQQIDRQEM